VIATVGHDRAMSTAGYSATPLAKKLGIRAEARVALINQPDHFLELLAPVPDAVDFATTRRGAADVVAMFVTRRSEIERRISSAGQTIFPNGGHWIARPKRSSKEPTDMTEHVVREVALPLGLVDHRVCAIDDTWSGLRIVWRKELR
jgi:hypothetical protein